jgi:hypothetical protein
LEKFPYGKDFVLLRDSFEISASNREKDEGGRVKPARPLFGVAVSPFPLNRNLSGRATDDNLIAELADFIIL